MTKYLENKESTICLIRHIPELRTRSLSTLPGYWEILDGSIGDFMMEYNEISNAVNNNLFLTILEIEDQKYIKFLS